MSTHVSSAVAYGDGIGPEIAEALLQIINEAGARVHLEVIEIGEQACLRGNNELGVKTETLRS
ncbi:MAG: hypothetical protein JOZ32_04370 [Bryobacterales bacterium]|nr:hypothetical protein [Bryobacterales bacterium]